MKKTLNIALLFLFLTIGINCTSQTNKSTNKQEQEQEQDVDNTPPIYFGIPQIISARDTSPAWNLEGQKILLTGIVYEPDGKTPAADVLIYYYHTNTGGRYLHKETEMRSIPPNSMGQSHGYIRGWVKTGKNGKYAIYTIKPGSYPSGDEAAHVHLYIKEPKREDHYYIDNFAFDDDLLLTATKRKALRNRGGSGILKLVRKGELQIGERNIILGLNVPD